MKTLVNIGSFQDVVIHSERSAVIEPGTNPKSGDFLPHRNSCSKIVAYRRVYLTDGYSYKIEELEINAADILKLAEEINKLNELPLIDDKYYQDYF